MILFLIFLDVSGAIKLWDIAEGKLLKSFSSENITSPKLTSVYALNFCQDGKILASCGSDNTVKIWDAQKSTALASICEEPVAVFHTKQTPLMTAKFTSRNVLSVIGTFATE
jgi:transcription initiation factor TFIID subunit 5